MAETIEKLIDKANCKMSKGSCAFWTEKQAKDQIDVVSASPRLLAIVEANIELAMCSDNEAVSHLAFELFKQKVASDKKALVELEKTIESFWPTGVGKNFQGAEDILELSSNFKNIVEIIKSRPVEALTSSSSYVRSLARQILPKDEYKRLTKELKAVSKKFPRKVGRQK